MFASVLAEEKEKLSTPEFIENNDSSDSIENLIEEFREKGFKGLFKSIEEEKIKKLRQEILREMGFTEKTLSELSPKQRAAIEKLVSEEIQKRMALGTIENQEDPEKTRLLQNDLKTPNFFSKPGNFNNQMFQEFSSLNLSINPADPDYKKRG